MRVACLPAWAAEDRKPPVPSAIAARGSLVQHHNIATTHNTVSSRHCAPTLKLLAAAR